MRVTSSARLKLLEIIKYLLYARLFLEAHESMMLSCTAEIYLMEVNSAADVISHLTAWIVLIICIVMPVIAMYLFYTTRKNFDPQRKFVLMEFFADLKNSQWARVYTAMLLIRRVVFVAFVIFLPGNITRYFIYSIILALQLIYTIGIVNYSPINRYRF